MNEYKSFEMILSKGRMVLKKTKIKQFIFILTASVMMAPSLYAQEEDPSFLTDLIQRIGNLEEENRELRGLLEEARHDMDLLKKQMDTLSADVDFRLNAVEGEGAPMILAPTNSLEEKKGDKAPSSSLEDEYEKARSLLEQGEYESAEKAFAAFVKAHPKDKLAGAAQYWLGVAYFVRGEHEKAVASFAKGYKNYPKSSKASDNLLKLAKSLSALDRKADACTTLDQLASDFPKTHEKELAAERKKLKCK